VREGDREGAGARERRRAGATRWAQEASTGGATATREPQNRSSPEFARAFDDCESGGTAGGGGCLAALWRTGLFVPDRGSAGGIREDRR
jgi:hypothetical protein